MLPSGLTTQDGLSVYQATKKSQLKNFTAQAFHRAARSVGKGDSSHSLIRGEGTWENKKHKIDVGTAKPIKQRRYPVSPAIEKLMYDERMLTLCL